MPLHLYKNRSRGSILGGSLFFLDVYQGCILPKRHEEGGTKIRSYLEHFPLYIGMVKPLQPQLGLGLASGMSRGSISPEEDRVLQHLAVHRTSRNLSSSYRHEPQRQFHGVSFLHSTRAVDVASLPLTWERFFYRTLGNEWRKHRRPREHRRLFGRIDVVGAVGRMSPLSALRSIRVHRPTQSTPPRTPSPNGLHS